MAYGERGAGNVVMGGHRVSGQQVVNAWWWAKGCVISGCQ